MKIVNAAVVMPSKVVENATILIEDGRITAALTIFTRWGPSAAAGRQHASSPKMGIRVFMLLLFFFVDILNTPAEQEHGKQGYGEEQTAEDEERRPARAGDHRHDDHREMCIRDRTGRA